ncbi:MAG: hypothetical protein PVH50_01590 [Anaerolineae bacterium]
MRANERDRDRGTPGRESQKVRLFSEYVDRLMEERGEVPKELGGMMTVAAWLAERGKEPQPPFRRRLEGSLRQQWTARHGAPCAPRRRWLHDVWPWPRLASAGPRWRAALAGTLLSLILAVGLLLGNTDVRAQIRQWLEWTGIHEVQGTPDWKVEFTQMPGPGSLSEAQAQVDFRILQPTRLPSGYSLAGAGVHHLHDEFAIGPTVALHYYGEGGGGPRSSIYVQEFRARHEVHEVVKRGYSRNVTVNGRQAIYIDGRWEHGQDGTPREWKTGDTDRLLFEVGDVVVWMQARRPPLGLDRLIQIAESFQ